jgi:hypothetical protein
LACHVEGLEDLDGHQQRWTNLGSHRVVELTCLSNRLASVNGKLWDIENDLRACEANNDFGPRFIALARAVYVTNDERAAIKRQINDLLGSTLVEEKAYTPYQDVFRADGSLQTPDV